MKAVGYKTMGDLSNSDIFSDIEIEKPIAKGHDILVKVEAVSVNPIDCKIRRTVNPEEGQYKILGWDGAGEVVSIGDDVTHFDVGDKVFYAGDLNRQGSNAQYQLVDERIAGHQPKTLSSAQAAALPLTSITAWEILFEHFNMPQRSLNPLSPRHEILLIVGAAGGVGSMLIQLAKQLTGIKVIATASREGSQAWVKEMGADYVIDHRLPLKEQIKALGIDEVTHIAGLTHSDSYLDSYYDLLCLQGKITLTDVPLSVDVNKLRFKSLSLHMQFMFARTLHQSKDMKAQGQILERIARLVDSGAIKTTMKEDMGIICSKNIYNAHYELEKGMTIGKTVLAGF